MNPMKWHSECIVFMGGGTTAIQLVPGQFPFLRNAEKWTLKH